ncbi:MAG: DUF192 domain-containing protein [Candidatus Marsarchaeota archaeon]|nr:DUF192 domain-containing protein [Candidatus Marsarchaeota archaeon]
MPILKAIKSMLHYEHKAVVIAGKELDARISDSFIKRMIGLMYEDDMPKNSCMLFVSRFSSTESIWMKDMRFSIDIIWLDKYKHIVATEENVPPCKKILFCKTYKPDIPFRFVVELNAGFIKENGITKSSIIEFK